MNIKLTQEIIRHILSNFRILKSDFVNESSKKLTDKSFLLNDKIEDIEENKYNLWGCQLSSNDNEIKILFSDLSLEDNLKEYALLVHLKDAPAYGLYLNDSKDQSRIDNPMIACHIENNWLICNTYLQSTFLAGMENLKEIDLNWSKCNNYVNEITLIKDFISFYNSYYYGENNAGETQGF